jgi:hypothetical protein
MSSVIGLIDFCVVIFPPLDGEGLMFPSWKSDGTVDGDILSKLCFNEWVTTNQR